MNTVAPQAINRPDQQTAPLIKTGTLRILATTDLHLHLTAHDYVTDTNKQNSGLAGIATLIATARAEAASQGSACLLFDNGDFLQGTAMGDWLARHPVADDHPAIACMQALDYDAFGVGNHDLDYGVPYLKQVAERLRRPTIASNLNAPDITPLVPSALIPCTLPATDHRPASQLKVGVLSVLPQQTALWNHHLLNGIATVGSAATSLRAAVPKLRAQGADIIVVLAHMGLDSNNGEDETALTLAQIPGIDAMITGHTHRRFPSRDHARIRGVSTTKSTISRVPTVMPGHAGSDLAVLDLSISQGPDSNWHVRQHKVALRQNRSDTPPAPAILAATDKIQTKLRHHLAEEVGSTPQDIHNFFALTQPTHTCSLTARAKIHIARKGLRGSALANLPLLASSSAHSAGGRDGPQNFIFIPNGPVLRRHLWGLNPYGNQVWVVQVTGAELKVRLEHAASVFTTLSNGQPDQLLRNPLKPVFDFDTIFGIRYVIDISQPVGKRITSLHYQNTAVESDQRFLLTTNQFRVAGGGGYPPLLTDRVILRSPMVLEEGLTSALSPPPTESWEPQPWSFAPLPGVSATIKTTPNAAAYLDEIAHLAPQGQQETQDGFIQLRLSF